MNITHILIVTACLIVAALVGYALYLSLQLRAQALETKRQQQKLAAELAERRSHYRNSIRVICAAIVEEQVSLTEASIRISMLASQLALTEEEKPHFQVFFQLTEATSHIPILEEWKQLSKQEKLRFDLEREKLEDSFREFVEDIARRLLDGTITAEGVTLSREERLVEGSSSGVTSSGPETEPLYYSVGKE